MAGPTSQILIPWISSRIPLFAFPCYPSAAAMLLVQDSHHRTVLSTRRGDFLAILIRNSHTTITLPFQRELESPKKWQRRSSAPCVHSGAEMTTRPDKPRPHVPGRLATPPRRLPQWPLLPRLPRRPLIGPLPRTRPAQAPRSLQFRVRHATFFRVSPSPAPVGSRVAFALAVSRGAPCWTRPRTAASGPSQQRWAVRREGRRA